MMRNNHGYTATMTNTQDMDDSLAHSIADVQTSPSMPLPATTLAMLNTTTEAETSPQQAKKHKKKPKFNPKHYKTTLCRSVTNCDGVPAPCKFGPKCDYAHNELELRESGDNELYLPHHTIEVINIHKEYLEKHYEGFQGPAPPEHLPAEGVDDARRQALLRMYPRKYRTVVQVIEHVAGLPEEAREPLPEDAPAAIAPVAVVLVEEVQPHYVQPSPAMTSGSRKGAVHTTTLPDGTYHFTPCWPVAPHPPQQPYGGLATAEGFYAAPGVQEENYQEDVFLPEYMSMDYAPQYYP